MRRVPAAPAPTRGSASTTSASAIAARSSWISSTSATTVGVFERVKHQITVADRSVGDSCSQHTECRQPLQACISAKCGCIEGAYYDAGTNQCLGVARCPFGTTPGKPCRRLSSARSDFENVLNDKKGVKTDTCDEGQY